MNGLDLERVVAKTSISKTAWYEGIKEGVYPRPLKAGRKSIWLDHEVDAALQRLASQRDDVAAQGAA